MVEASLNRGLLWKSKRGNSIMTCRRYEVVLALRQNCRFFFLMPNRAYLPVYDAKSAVRVCVSVTSPDLKTPRLCVSISTSHSYSTTYHVQRAQLP